MGYRGTGFTPLARGWRGAEESSSRSAAGVGGGGVGEPRCCCGDHKCSVVHKSGSSSPWLLSDPDGAEPARVSKAHETLVKG